MKVLFISSWFPNSVNALKGIYILKHAEAIKKAGIEIEVVAITINPSLKTFERKIESKINDLGIKIHSVELNSRFYKWIHINLFFQYRVISKYINKSVIPNFRPTLIHANVLYPAAIIGHKLASRYNLPLIITEHWSKVDKFMNSSLFSYSGKKAYNYASIITVVSDFLKQSILKYVVDTNKIKIVPNVINTQIFTHQEKKINEDILVFTIVAHWAAPKRPDLIFACLQELSQSIDKKIILNVVGEGILINYLRHQIWNFEINYLGNVDSEKLANTLHKSNYFLHASDMETFSVVIAEALATGTPVLASRVGAIPELVNYSNGILTNNTIEDWNLNIKQLVNTKFDTELISKDALRFDSSEIGKQFVKVYNSI